MTDDEYEELRARYRDAPPSVTALDVFMLVAVIGVIGWVVWYVWDQHAEIERQHQEQRALFMRCNDPKVAPQYWNCNNVGR